MGQLALPKDILHDMQAAGILAFDTIIAGRLDNVDQGVDCTAEMAAWCRLEAQRREGADRSRLLAIADMIERDLREGHA
jgi:hypothetical protein